MNVRESEKKKKAKKESNKHHSELNNKDKSKTSAMDASSFAALSLSLAHKSLFDYFSEEFTQSQSSRLNNSIINVNEAQDIYEMVISEPMSEELALDLIDVRDNTLKVEKLAFESLLDECADMKKHLKKIKNDMKSVDVSLISDKKEDKKFYVEQLKEDLKHITFLTGHVPELEDVINKNIARVNNLISKINSHLVKNKIYKPNDPTLFDFTEVEKKSARSTKTKKPVPSF